MDNKKDHEDPQNWKESECFLICPLDDLLLPSKDLKECTKFFTSFHYIKLKIIENNLRENIKNMIIIFLT